MSDEFKTKYMLAVVRSLDDIEQGRKTNNNLAYRYGDRWIVTQIYEIKIRDFERLEDTKEDEH